MNSNDIFTMQGKLFHAFEGCEDMTAEQARAYAEAVDALGKLFQALHTEEGLK